MFLTEITICYSNNKALKKWANGKVFNIMTSAQFFMAYFMPGSFGMLFLRCGEVSRQVYGN